MCRTRLWRILPQLLSSPQKDRGLEAYSQPKAHKWSNKEAVLQNGDGSIGDESFESGGLDGITGSERRVLSHPDLSRPQEISSVLYPRPFLSVQSSSFWPNDIPKDFYQSPSTCHSVPPLQGNPSIPILGRHSVQCQVGGQASQSDETGETSVHSSRLHHQRSEVLHDAVTGHGFHRSKDSILEGPGVTPPREGSESGSSCQEFCGGSDLLSQAVAHSPRSDGSHSGSDKTCQVTYETSPTVRSLPLEQVRSRARLPAGGQPGSPHAHTVVDRSESPVIRFAPVPPRGTDCDHHRCILSRLGRSAGPGKPGGGAI